MPINFPTGPTVGQEYIAGVKKWTWNGVGWQSTSVTYGPTGPTGATGATGITGPTGTAGATGIAVYDTDQAVISMQVFG